MPMVESLMIHVSRKGEALGVFNQDIATQCLIADILKSTDLAWTEGLNEWVPLGELLGVSDLPLPSVAH